MINGDVMDTAMLSDLPDFRVGKGLVADNLRRAIDSGHLVLTADGKFGWPAKQKQDTSTWFFVRNARPEYPSCNFLMDFLFETAYSRQAVPHGCRSCYKVKVLPRTLKQTVALRDVARAIPCLSKCGPEVHSPYTASLYGGFFYCTGLDHAREIYRQVRVAVDANPALGPDIAMRIKRGCTEYEVYCGPSDRWTFQAGQEELEAQLQQRFRSMTGKKKEGDEFSLLMKWIEIAYAIGDDTYLEFTRGRRLFPETVSYSP